MKLLVGKRMIDMNAAEVKAAKKLASAILNRIQREAEEKRALSLYYTFLVVMHKTTGDRINALGLDLISAYTDRTRRPPH